MKVFIRTLIITFIACVVYHFYSGAHLIDGNGQIKKAPPVPIENKTKEKPTTKKDKTDLPVVNKGVYGVSQSQENSARICMISKSGDFIFVRRIKSTDKLEETIRLLLKGTTKEESSKGIYSEIPANAKLFWVRESKDKIIVNLSSEFAEGGGTQTVMARINQLSKTVKAEKKDLPVYLYINGKIVEYIGGDGVYLEQPLN
jgi:spore germination protein GerM